MTGLKDIQKEETNMKFQLAVNLERLDDSLAMDEVARHTLEMVQMAEDGGFNIVWAAEHHALEMTIAPNPFQILTWCCLLYTSPSPRDRG